MKRRRGRPLKKRSDTARLDYVLKLLGFGQRRVDVAFMWHGHQLILATSKGLPTPIAADDDGDLRALLDRALSPTAKKRGRRS